MSDEDDRHAVFGMFMRGELLPRDKVGQAMSELMIDVRKSVMAVPHRLAPELQGLSAAEVESRLTAALKKALEDVAHQQLAAVTNPSNSSH